MLDLTESFKTFPVLQTERLHLRAMVPQDAEAVFALLGDPEVMVWHGRPPFATLEEAQKHIAWYAEAFAEKRAIRWAITRGQFVAQNRLYGGRVFARAVF